jgi:hypothetical protein
MPVDDVRVVYLDPQGPVISTADDTSDLIGSAWADDAGLIAIPVARLDPAFFVLRSGLAGAITQKLVNYRLRLAVVGDITALVAANESLAAYVREANRGSQVWFVPDQAALHARLRG